MERIYFERWVYDVYEVWELSSYCFGDVFFPWVVRLYYVSQSLVVCKIDHTPEVRI